MKKSKKQILLSLILTVMFQCFSFGQGSTYSGSYVVSKPIVWNGVNNAIISKLQITNTSGHCISLINCSNITIEDCKLGPSLGNAVDIDHCTNITITNCSMANIASGVYVCTGSGISVTYNDILNVQGPFPRGQMVQFNTVSGTGNRINYNSCDNISGQSNPEDLVNLFKSNGTINDPIQVIGNWIRGGGPSTSGGGLLAGDNGGSYQLFENNICVNTANEGIEVAGGHDITVNNNTFYSQKTAISGVAISVYNQCIDPSFNITVQNNQTNWTHYSGVLNNLCDAGKSGVITGWSTNIYDPNLNSSILPPIIIGKAQGVTTETIPITLNEKYNIYPNPFYGHLSIEKSTIPINEKIFIYNLNGQQIIEQTLNDSKTDINTNTLSAGVYILKIMKDNKIIDVRKIIAGVN